MKPIQGGVSLIKLWRVKIKMAFNISATAGGLDFKSLAEQYGVRTVREVVSSTGGLALAQMVAARAGIQLATLVDARQLCRVDQVPPGGGVTYHFQFVQIPAAGSFEATVSNEAADITATDATLSDAQATLAIIGVRTDVSDLAQRQAAVNLAEVLGIAHGNALNRGVNTAIYGALDNSSTNVISLGTAADGKSTAYGFNDIFNARGLIEAQRGKADTFVTYPYKAAVGTGGAATGFYPFVQSNITSVQFTTALASYLQTGQISELFGMKLYVDQVYAPSNAGADGARYASICNGGEAIGWAQAEDIVSEIQRWAAAIGFRIVTHVTGGAKEVIEPFTALIKHAA